MTNTIDVKVPPEFWATSILPGGFIEKWLLPNGSQVRSGDPIADIRIEGMLHRLLAPGAGLLQVTSKANSVVDPGLAIGRIVLGRDA